MKYKYLTLIPLLAAQCALAGAADSAATELSSAPSLTHIAALQPLPYRANDVATVSFCSGLTLGYVRSSSDHNGIKGSGGGFGGKIEWGIKYALPSGIESKYNFLSATIEYCIQSAKDKFKGDSGDISTKYKFQAIGVPLTFTHINVTRSVGYYWQLGVNLNFTNSASAEDPGGIRSFASFYAEPFASAGIAYFGSSERGLLRHHLILFGLYASDAISNMSKDDGTSLHMAVFGIKMATFSH